MTDSAAPPVIEFRQAGLTYPGRPPVTALHPSDLTVRRGEFVTVVGPSGSGKSTLLNVIGLLDRPTTGSYFLDGLDTGGLGDARRTALRGHRIGFVFQAFHLLPHRTALENVMLGMVYNTAVPRGDRRERAREALLRVGLGHRLDSLPTRMSGGERQRVAVARALAHGPSLLLCDEPTGNLDSMNSRRVLDLLATLHEDGMTVLVITHDREVAAQGARTVTVRDGVLAPAAADEARPARSGAGSGVLDLPDGRPA
ncbi:ABC transporter ATP-binding protein [Streptomyces sp. NBC_00335]|uniref:ABC transporter ATP-binding protein n=1 Tax=unclassified Streptomyces TaxID=2593676 RepID=UPI00225294C1|nr:MULTISPECIES: ABC transporter ATP-binding protein [unclassified Streptomyces]MCX5404648.1 ABC transporter ATP-binding protein [Streptomyces sp. NBC_00086]